MKRSCGKRNIVPIAQDVTCQPHCHIITITYFDLRISVRDDVISNNSIKRQCFHIVLKEIMFWHLWLWTHMDLVTISISDSSIKYVHVDSRGNCLAIYGFGPIKVFRLPIAYRILQLNIYMLIRHLIRTKMKRWVISTH